MATESFNTLRRFAGYAFMLLLCGVLLMGSAAGQSPLVTASVSATANHPSITSFGQIFNTAITTKGDLLVETYTDGTLTEFPAGGGPAVMLVGQGGLNWWGNPGMALDSANNLYLDGNWNNCLMRFPYNAATGTWTGLSGVTSGNPISACNSPYNVAQYGLISWNWGFQPWGLAVGPNNTVVVSDNSGNFLFTFQVDSNGNASNPVEVVKKLKSRATSIAMDKYGNIYLVEEPDNSRYAGVLMIPAGSTGLADESGLSRVDPNLSNVWGVSVDAAGNLYVSDGVQGVFYVPNVNGTPNPSAAVLLSPIPAEGSASVDSARNILYIPTPYTTLWSWDGDVKAVNFSSFEAGSSTLGTASATNLTVTYSFSGSVTPASFSILEGGATSKDFVIATGGTCGAGTAYSSPNSCTVNVAVNPLTAGNVSAQLRMLDASGNVLNAITLHGTGTGASTAVFPSMEANLGSGFKAPNQVATDATGNVYVADAGLKSILVATPVSTGTTFTTLKVNATLAAPTGVAVDGTGNLFFADSGSVYEIPYTSSGLMAASQVTLKTGLGGNNQLVVDGEGTLYISDPTNARVIRLVSPGGALAPATQAETDFTTGFTAPTAMAVDANNNLYVVDGANLFEVSNLGALTALPVTLSNATGIAVDPSGAVYLSSTGGTVRIPVVSGVLTPANQATVATAVTTPAGLSLDKWGNLYIADSTALDVHLVSASGALNLGTLATTSSTSNATATIQNNGNSTLDVTGVTSATVDYTASATACTNGAALAVNGTCAVTVTFNPGPGDQGTLAGGILIASNAGNGPIINTTGVGAALAVSKSAISVSSATSVNVPVTVTVTAASGSAVPTGTVTITVDGTGPMTATLKNGTVTTTLNYAVTAGKHSVAVLYNGDRVFGKSTGAATVTVGRGAVAFTTATPPNYTLSADGYTPYSGPANSPYSSYSIATQYYPANLFKVHVSAVEGVPTGTVTFWESNALACGTSGIDPAVAAGSVTAATPDIYYNTLTSSGGLAYAAAVNVKLDANGDAIWDSSCLTIPSDTNSSPQTVNPHTVIAVYNGDANYIGSIASTLSFKVLRNPSVILSTTTPSLTVSAGSSASAVLTITPLAGYGVAGLSQLLNNYTLPLGFNCSGLPAHTTCSFSPTSISFTQTDGNNADSVGVPSGTVTVTINTDVSAGTVTSQNYIQRGTMTLAGLFGVGLLGLAFRRRSRRLTMTIGMIAIAVLLAGMTACSTTNLTPAASLNTPAGTYAVTVTADQVGSGTAVTTNGTETVYGSNNEMSVPFSLNVTIQ